LSALKIYYCFTAGFEVALISLRVEEKMVRAVLQPARPGKAVTPGAKIEGAV
jgi:hypothetical protein